MDFELFKKNVQETMSGITENEVVFLWETLEEDEEVDEMEWVRWSYPEIKNHFNWLDYSNEEVLERLKSKTIAYELEDQFTVLFKIY